jgi:hypothetical protein
VDLSLQLTAFLVSKLFCKKVEIAIYILGSSLLNNQYSLSELFKYGKLLHKICISFTKRHLSLMYKGHSNRKCNSSSTLSRLQNKHFLCSRSSFFLHSHLHPYIFHICQSLFVRNEH